MASFCSFISFRFFLHTVVLLCPSLCCVSRGVYVQLAAYVNISLIEGGKRLLGTYPPEISSFAEKILSDDLHVKLFLNSTVVGVEKDSIRFVKNIPRNSGDNSHAQEGEKKTQVCAEGLPLLLM